MNMNLYMPTRLFTGKGCLKRNGSEMAKLGKSCLILTGKRGAKACGALDDVTAVLDEHGICWEVFDEISQNPLLTECMKAAEVALEKRAEFLIGIGGGSPMDAAKCTAILTANPGMSQAELYSLKWKNEPLPVVAVGTTSGTGSEVTKVSVITNLQGRKKSVKADSMYPVVSFGDPSYTETLSDYFTRSTAIDALAHCMESYLSAQANEISRTYAVRGIRILLKEFETIISDGVEKLTFEDREALYHASIYGGLAIAITGTCMPHGMGYLLTEEAGLPHGIACAVFLPDFYAHVKKTTPELAEKFLKDIHSTEEEFLKLLKEMIPAYRVKMTEEMIEREHGRWEGNAALAKTESEITADQADEILRKLFLRKQEYKR